MREIKFRAFDVKNNEIRYGYPIIEKGKVTTFVEDITGSYFGINYWPFHLMQYTGANDSTGKEIYEGDILSYKDNTGVVGYSTQVTGYYVKLRNGDGPILYNHGEWNVIGNIYENPEIELSYNGK